MTRASAPRDPGQRRRSGPLIRVDRDEASEDGRAAVKFCHAASPTERHAAEASSSARSQPAPVLVLERTPEGVHGGVLVGKTEPLEREAAPFVPADRPNGLEAEAHGLVVLFGLHHTSLAPGGRISWSIRSPSGHGSVTGRSGNHLRPRPPRSRLLFSGPRRASCESERRRPARPRRHDPRRGGRRARARDRSRSVREMPHVLAPGDIAGSFVRRCQAIDVSRRARGGGRRSPRASVASRSGLSARRVGELDLFTEPGRSATDLVSGTAPLLGARAWGLGRFCGASTGANPPRLVLSNQPSPIAANGDSGRTLSCGRSWPQERQTTRGRASAAGWAGAHEGFGSRCARKSSTRPANSARMRRTSSRGASTGSPRR